MHERWLIRTAPNQFTAQPNCDEYGVSSDLAVARVKGQSKAASRQCSVSAAELESLEGPDA